MKLVLGVLFAVTQASKKGGIVREFHVCSDGLSPAPDLGNSGLKHWRFTELFSCWIYATLDDGDNEDQADPYWEKIKWYNNLMITTRITWSIGGRLRLMNRYSQPGGGHKVDRKPRGFGPEYRCHLQLGSK